MHLVIHPFTYLIAKQTLPGILWGLPGFLGLGATQQAGSLGRSEPSVPVGDPNDIPGRTWAGTTAELLDVGLAEGERHTACS